MLSIKRQLLFSFFLALIFVSCTSTKKVVYFQNSEVNQDLVTNDYKLVFKKDDLLQITVTSEDVKSALPFNLPIIGVDGAINSPLGQPKFQNYLIDSQGFIFFPILGKIKLLGLDREKAIEKISNLLSPKYIKNPIVNIRLINFRITVLGDVRNPGSFIIPNERISLLEAIGLAGDLNISGERKIMVTRERDGKKTNFEVDLLSKETFTSPVYYLEQNDIIYVRPNYYKSQNAAYNPNTSFFISIGSVFIALITLLVR